jgi:nucleoside-diphosphate-sugar epimerase
MNLNGARVLVTGGAGFIGSHLVAALVGDGCRVTVIDSLSSGKLANLNQLRQQIKLCERDIRDRESVEAAVDGCDVVFHQAAVVSVPETVENPVESALVNDIGTLIVLDVARRKKVRRVVLASFCAVYGDDPQLPKHEALAPKPCSPYVVQKLTGEYHARLYFELYGLETVCLRYFNVFGPRQDASSPYSGVISLFLTKALRRETPVIFGDGRQSRDFVFVKDVVKANLLAACAPDAAGSVLNVGTGSAVEIRHLWQAICSLCGLSVQPRFAPARPGDILQSVADIRQVHESIGFSPDFSFEAGLEKTLGWYQTEMTSQD